MRTMTTTICMVAILGILPGDGPVVHAADPLRSLDPDRYGPGTLIAALEELELYRPPEAVDLILPLLGHEDPDVARTAAWLLRRMDHAAEGVIAATAVLSDPARSSTSRASAALGMGVRSTQAIPALATALAGDGSLEVRVTTAQALGALHRTEAKDALVQALNQDSEPIVRAAAGAALGNVPGIQASDLMPALGDTDPLVRREAAWSLGRHQLREAIGNLQGALQDSDCRVGAAAAWGLARIQDPAAVDALQAASKGPCRLTAQAAKWALTQIPH